MKRKTRRLTNSHQHFHLILFYIYICLRVRIRYNIISTSPTPTRQLLLELAPTGITWKRTARSKGIRHFTPPTHDLEKVNTTWCFTRFWNMKITSQVDSHDINTCYWGEALPAPPLRPRTITCLGWRWLVCHLKEQKQENESLSYLGNTCSPRTRLEHAQHTCDCTHLER